MAAAPVRREVVLDALDLAVDEMANGAALAEMAGKPPVDVERWRLAGDVIADLVDNVRVGVSEVWRSSTGTVFIVTAAVEPVEGSGLVIAKSRGLGDPEVS